MVEFLQALLSATLEAAPALVFATLGAVLSERSGVVNVGIEGMMRVGAFAAAVAALAMPTPLAALVGMGAGALTAGLHALLCLKARANQVVSGMAINLVALAGITFLLETWFQPYGTPSITQLERWRWDWLAQVPLLGALSGHTLLVPLALALPFALQLLLMRTPLGLRIRTVGERPEAAATLGLSVLGLRGACVLASGLLAGLGGAALSLSTLDRFEQHMPAGLGFMAVAAMVFGRWSPLGAAGAALFFAAGNALRISLGTSAPGLLEVVPQGVLLALPYLLTLVVLTAQGRRTRAPAALGTPYAPEAR